MVHVTSGFWITAQMAKLQPRDDLHDLRRGKFTEKNQQLHLKNILKKGGAINKKHLINQNEKHKS